MERGDHMVRWTTTASVVLLAAIAAIVSYRHMHTLVVAHGETAWTAAVLPLSVDGMIAASSMTLLADSRHGRKSGILPWARAVTQVGRASRNIPRSTPSAPGRPPRQRYCRRRVHGPAGRLLWEDVIPSEVGRRPPEDVVFHLQLLVTAPQLSELLFSVLVSCSESGFSSASACRIQFCKQDRLIPRSLAN
jgi:hypothetical protein